MGWRSMEADWYNGIAYCCECGKEFDASDSVTEDGADSAVCSDACYDKLFELPSPLIVETTNKQEPDIVY
jgi:hypothetical protein